MRKFKIVFEAYEMGGSNSVIHEKSQMVVEIDMKAITTKAEAEANEMVDCTDAERVMSVDTRKQMEIYKIVGAATYAILQSVRGKIETALK